MTREKSNFRSEAGSKRRQRSGKFLLSAFLLLALCSMADQWIVDGRKVVIATDPQAARNFGTNTVYYTTNAVARWVSLTNGIALEVHSSAGWVRQVEWTED